MKDRSLGTKLWMLVITLGVVAYFAMQAWNYYDDPLSTTLAYTYQVELGAELNGFVVRREQVLPAEESGLLRLERREGERVSAGGVVARVYKDQASLDRQAELQRLEERIGQLEYARDSMLNAEAALKLDSHILRAILQYRSAITAGHLEQTEETDQELRSLVLKRDYTYSGGEDLDAQLHALQADYKALSAKSAGTVRSLRAPRAGLYSAVTDGYEAVLTVDRLSTLTPRALTGLRADPAALSNTGKLVLGDSWYYAAVMDRADARSLEERETALRRQGGTLLLRFTRGGGRALPVKIDSVNAEEDGQCVVVLRGDTYLPELTLLRQQSAMLISDTVEGVRVPSAALRVDVRTAEDGGETRVTGVYCIVGARASFKPVEILYSGDGFALVRSVPASEKDRLRPGDEVIVAARNLYDGKVVNG